jgi:DNA-binding NarL/FixJ family response regulator
MPAIRDHPVHAGARSARGADAVLRVLVVDDHPAVRRGLHELLQDQPDFHVLDAVASAEEAMSVVERTAIDVAVVDYQLGSRSGLWLSRKLKRLAPPPRVVVYSAYCDGPLAAAAVVAEADGLVSKAGVGSELCSTIRAVARGEQRLPVVPLALAAAMRRRLDAEEQAIFGMLLAGISPPEIAQTLGISVGWVESRLWAMLRRLEGLEAETLGPEMPAARRPRRRSGGG